MAPSVALLDPLNQESWHDHRPTKRQKPDSRSDARREGRTEHSAHCEVESPDVVIRQDVNPSDSTTADVSGVTPHPLGIKPLGNLYEAQSPNLIRNAGLFSFLPDELVIQVLEYVGAKELVNLGSTCKALYAFARAEELWKPLVVELAADGGLPWLGSWRSTYLKLPVHKVKSISCSGLFSDILHRPFHCAHIPLLPYTTNIPSRNAISRFEGLSSKDYTETWYAKPFILTKPVKEWPVHRNWSTSALLSMHGSTSFRCEAVDWPLTTYVDYMRSTSDESPLYLFDCRFVEKMGLDTTEGTGDYWPPPCFGPDLFAALGSQRPDSRWLIIGPARSGSTFHKDPNATSAWNAVIRGSKYWIMFPSAANMPPPPGVFVSEDQSEVTSPLSIAEWLLGFHAEARRTPGCVEGICKEGEVLHVPSGWYHLVLNIEDGIAITQNFIPRAHLSDAMSFLRDRQNQVSGFRKEIDDPYRLFVEKMREQHPEILEEGLKELDERDRPKKTKWEEVTAKEDSKDADGFSFGFGGDEDYDDEDES